MRHTRGQAPGKSTKKANAASAWGKAKRKNGKSRNGSNGKASIETLLEAENWAAAQEEIEKALLDEPTDHWLWIHLGLTHYEQRQYEEAQKHYARAVALAPRCPLALWHYAGCLDMLEQADSALALWTILLNMDVEEVAYGDHGEGMDWALSLINDTHYRMARFFQRNKESSRARESYEKYLHNRKHGVASIYDRSAAEAHLAEVKRAENSVA